jgi:hypothetical protein
LAAVGIPSEGEPDAAFMVVDRLVEEMMLVFMWIEPPHREKM